MSLWQQDGQEVAHPCIGGGSEGEAMFRQLGGDGGGERLKAQLARGLPTGGRISLPAAIDTGGCHRELELIGQAW